MPGVEEVREAANKDEIEEKFLNSIRGKPGWTIHDYPEDSNKKDMQEDKKDQKD